MKINTNYSNYIYSKCFCSAAKADVCKNVASISNGLTFSGLKTEGVHKEMLDKIFQGKMEAYGIIADAKNLDVKVSDENGVLKIKVFDTKTDEELKELNTQDPGSNNFKYAFARAMLLANAPDNVVAGNAVFSKYAETLPIEVPEDQKGNIEFVHKMLKSEMIKQSRCLEILEQNLTTSDNPDYIVYLKNTNMDYLKAKEQYEKVQSAFDMVDFAREYTEEGRSYTTNLSWRALLETVQP